MGIFGGGNSKSTNATTQQGAEGDDNLIIGNSSTYAPVDNSSITNIDYFPDSVANFFDEAISKVFDLAGDTIEGATSSQESLGRVAEVTKSDISAFVPIVGLIAGAVIVYAIFKG